MRRGTPLAVWKPGEETAGEKLLATVSAGGEELTQRPVPSGAGQGRAPRRETPHRSGRSVSGTASGVVRL